MKNIKIWIYGDPFSGKSYFANQFPKPFCINTDGNAQFYDVPYVVVSNAEEFLTALQKFNAKEYDTLIIDVADHVYDFVREYYLTKNNIDHESDLDWGKGWTLVREGFWQIINKISRLQCNVVLIGHSDMYEVKSKLGKTETYFRPSIADKLHKRLCGIMQLVGRAYKDDKTINGEVVSRYFISFGNNSNELSGIRVPLKNKLISNSYEEFKNNIVKKED